MQLGADRIKEIVLSLRIFSRLDEAELKFTNIPGGVESTLTILGHRLKQLPDRCAIEVVRDYGEMPLVKCYAGQLNQVLMNLIANAVDAIEEDIARRESVDLKSFPQSQITVTTRVKGDRCVIAIADSGPGMPPEVRDRIFDPFFTTKPVGKGTGMGLAISYQIVTEKHGGRLTCTSQPGQGTTFAIELPINGVG
ncbi:MAG: ATP-binding protein [Cyanobacteria bacterium P01_H01_bin.130]